MIHFVISIKNTAPNRRGNQFAIEKKIEVEMNFFFIISDNDRTKVSPCAGIAVQIPA